MPAVTVLGRPNGLPIATTLSPTCSAEESPKVSGCSSEESTFLTRMTARSAPVSEPIKVAGAFTPSGKVTVMLLAPDTTCSSVTMSPFLSNTTPAPSPSVC